VRSPVLTHLNLAPGFRGGERQTELLIRGLAALGWPQRLVCRAGAPLGARCADIPDLDIRPAGWGVAGALLQLQGAGLVHSHEGRGVQAAWLQHLLVGTPYLITRRVQQGPRHTWLNRRMYAGAAGVVAISEAIRRALGALDPDLAVPVIPSASSGFTARLGVVERLRASFGAGAEHSFVVGHVGALVDAHKGQRQIIALARRLRQRDPQVRFVLLGTGRDEQQLQQEAAGLDNLIFAGHVDNVGDFLAAFDLFFYPSRHEGLGSVLLDALDFGLPVVATAVGGIPEIIGDGVNGLLCAPDDLDAQERALQMFRDDPALRRRVGQANRHRAQEFSAATMARRYDALYRELTDLRPPKEPIP
jgi:glycosyltransferase involved in cell wall biosynthesis